MPASVSQGDICWPTGERAEGLPPAVCQRRMPAYLLDGLAAVGAAVTRFAFTQSTRPAVLTGLDPETQASLDEYKYLLMPVRLTG